MKHLIARLRRDIPKVFETDEFKARIKKINELHAEKRAKLFEEMEKKSRALGFAIQRTPIGINTLPCARRGNHSARRSTRLCPTRRRPRSGKSRTRSSP